MWYSQKSAGQLQRERVPGEVLVLLYKVQKAACGEASSFSWVVFRCGEASSLAAVSLLRQLFFHRVQKTMFRKPKLTTPGVGGRGRQLFIEPQVFKGIIRARATEAFGGSRRL